MTRILITGGNGFTGKHLSYELLHNRNCEVISLERLRSIGPEINHTNFSRVFHDFRAPLQDSLIHDIGKVDVIIHNGAEVHAIRSLTDPRSFVQSNCVGVFNMLEAARKLKPKKFIYTSSAEVFGLAPVGTYSSEDAALNPSNPYSAAKAGGEMLCHAYRKSFQVPLNIVRSMNMFGESQDETKFVPMVVKKALNHEVLKVHVKNGEIGSRQWIYIKNYVDALLFILERGAIGESYNVAGMELHNMEIVGAVNVILSPDNGVRTELIEAPSTHDIRYAISDTKLRNLGWSPKIEFSSSFQQTVHSLKRDFDTSIS